MGGGLKFSGGDGRTCCRHGDGLLPRHHSELCMEWKNMKIFEALSNGKKMVFYVKKLLNVGVGLTLGEKSERSDASGMSGRSIRFTPPMASYQQRTFTRQRLPRDFKTG